MNAQVPYNIVSHGRKKNKSRTDTTYRTTTLGLFKNQVTSMITQIPIIQDAIQVRLGLLILINDEHDIATAYVPMENLRIHPSILMR